MVQDQRELHQKFERKFRQIQSQIMSDLNTIQRMVKECKANKKLNWVFNQSSTSPPGAPLDQRTYGPDPLPMNCYPLR